MNAENKLTRLSRKKIRTCQTLHHCCLCNKNITWKERYYDGGYNNRAHVGCLELMAKQTGVEIKDNEEN